MDPGFCKIGNRLSSIGDLINMACKKRALVQTLTHVDARSNPWMRCRGPGLM